MITDKIDKLKGKDTKTAYKNLLDLEILSEESNVLYPYFEVFVSMLDSDISYIRVRGFRLICKLSKWDKENKIDKIIDKLLLELDDSKPTAVRQSLKALNYLLLYKVELSNIIEKYLKNINYKKYNDSMQPLIKKDIDEILERM